MIYKVCIISVVNNVVKETNKKAGTLQSQPSYLGGA